MPFVLLLSLVNSRKASSQTLDDSSGVVLVFFHRLIMEIPQDSQIAASLRRSHGTWPSPFK